MGSLFANLNQSVEEMPGYRYKNVCLVHWHDKFLDHDWDSRIYLYKTEQNKIFWQIFQNIPTDINYDI